MEREHNGEPAHASQDQDAQAPRHEAATGAEFAAPPAYEPEVSEASAGREHASPTRPREDAPHDESMPPSAPPAAPEPPRRRSTVREPAPGVAADETHAPQPKAPAEQPVITELGDSEPPDRPRRSGWWSRRFAGG
jgi:ribonuclease E